MRNAGFGLVIIGLAIMVWGIFGYTTRDKVVDIGPIDATKETKHDVPYGPLAGGLILVGGVVLIGMGKRVTNEPSLIILILLILFGGGGGYYYGGTYSNLEEGLAVYCCSS